MFSFFLLWDHGKGNQQISSASLFVNPGHPGFSDQMFLNGKFALGRKRKDFRAFLAGEHISLSPLLEQTQKAKLQGTRNIPLQFFSWRELSYETDTEQCVQDEAGVIVVRVKKDILSLYNLWTVLCV